jgi:hypothetical protein
MTQRLESAPDQGLHIFLSHASDDAAYAHALAERLEQAGQKVWYAPRDIAAGMPYPQAIVSAIERASAMLVLLTPYANQSKFVAREVETADRCGVTLVTYRTADTDPGQDLALFLNNRQWIDAFKVGEARAAADVLQAVAQARGVPAAQTRPAVPAPASRARPWWMAGALAVAVAAIAGMAWFIVAGRPDQATQSPEALIAAVGNGLGTMPATELVDRYAAPAVFTVASKANLAAFLAPASTAFQARTGPARLVFTEPASARAINAIAGKFHWGWVEVPVASGFLCLAVIATEDPTLRTWGFKEFYPFGPFTQPCMSLDDVRAAAREAERMIATVAASDLAPSDMSQEMRVLPAESLRSYFRIYRETLLKAGKPVVLDAKPSGGAQNVPRIGRFVLVRFAADNQFIKQNLDWWLIQEADGQWRLALPPAAPFQASAP